MRRKSQLRTTLLALESESWQAFPYRSPELIDDMFW